MRVPTKRALLLDNVGGFHLITYTMLCTNHIAIISSYNTHF